MDKEERNLRLERLKELFIGTPEGTNALGAMQDVFDVGSGRCLPVFGPTGAGKTWLARRFLKKYPSVETREKLKRPVVRVKVPVDCTLRGVALATKNKLIPEYNFGKHLMQTDYTEHVLFHLNEQEVRVIIFDDVQHIIDRASAKIAYAVADWIKIIIDESQCGVIVMGLTHAERVLMTNSQLERRAEPVIYLRPYDWRDEKQRLAYRMFLREVDKTLELPILSDLGATDTAKRIYHFSRGLKGDTMHLIWEAYKRALDADRPAITHDLFADAVDAFRVGAKQRLINPFREATIGPVVPASMYDDFVMRQQDEAAQRTPRKRR